MDNKLSIKFESGLYEQTYKFRMQEGLENMEDIKNLVDGAFVQSVEQILRSMHQTKMSAVARKMEDKREDEFEGII